MGGGQSSFRVGEIQNSPEKVHGQEILPNINQPPISL